MLGSHEYYLLRKADRRKWLNWAKAKDSSLQRVKRFSGASSEKAGLIKPPETEYRVKAGQTPEQATREKIERDNQLWPVETRPQLKDLPVEELASMKDAYIPPSRKKEVVEYRQRIRRESIKRADDRFARERGTKPGERMFDPRGYVGRRRQFSDVASSPSGSRWGKAPLSWEESLLPSQPSVHPLGSSVESSNKSLQPYALTLEESCQLIVSGRLNSFPGSQRCALVSRCLEDVSLLSADVLGEIILLEEFELIDPLVRKGAVDQFLLLERVSHG